MYGFGGLEQVEVGMLPWLDGQQTTEQGKGQSYRNPRLKEPTKGCL